ncbi:MAG: 8-oxo-dGTP diphosphatase [Bacilli bacterium]|nr:8-oxo-dGTP diphosphatase [Bacilli bacterium]
MTIQQQKPLLKYIMVLDSIICFILILIKQYYISIILGVMLVVLIIYCLSIRKVIETTLCLIVKDDQVLMMLRNKKKNDVHLHKYNGLGGKVEKGESMHDCVKREVYEEAGIILTNYKYIGKAIFKNFANSIGKEIMYCFVGYDYKNEIGECNEGELQWIPKNKVLELPLWEGDKYFLMDIIEARPFTIFLHYDGDKIVSHKIKRRITK